MDETAIIEQLNIITVKLAELDHALSDVRSDLTALDMRERDINDLTIKALESAHEALAKMNK